MQKPFRNSFEEQLKQKAENFSIKPSAKVWEGVSNQLEEDVIVGSNIAAGTGSSFFSNWMLNILIPAVVLISSGTIFYFNANKGNTNSTNELDNNSNSASTNLNLVKDNSAIAADANKASQLSSVTSVVDNSASNIVNTNHELITSRNEGNSEAVSGKNAIEQSFGYSSNSNENSKYFNDNADSDVSTKLSSENIFSKADLEKIAKKQMEHENTNELKERNIKHVVF